MSGKTQQPQVATVAKRRSETRGVRIAVKTVAGTTPARDVVTATVVDAPGDRVGVCLRNLALVADFDAALVRLPAGAAAAQRKRPPWPSRSR